MEMAVADVNSDPTILNGTQMDLVMEDLGCSAFMGSIKVTAKSHTFQCYREGSSGNYRPSVVCHHAYRLPHSQRPPNPGDLLCSHGSGPVLPPIPLLCQDSTPDSTQMLALADVIDLYGWKEVIAVFEDTDYGRNGVAALGDFLATRMSTIYYKLPLSPHYNHSEISEALVVSKSLGPLVYVVHIRPDPLLRFFEIAQSLGMVSADYVWLATDWLTSSLDSLSGDEDSFNLVRGVVTLRPRVAPTPKREALLARWEEMQKKKGLSKHSGLTEYGIYDYDTVWLVAYAVDKLLKEQGEITFSSTERFHELENFKVFDGGEALRRLVLASNFTGLLRQVRFDDSPDIVGTEYEVLNVGDNGYVRVGFWSNVTGLSVQSPELVRGNGQSLGRVTWPGGVAQRPRGWVVATSERPLRVGFPNRISFSDFVSQHNDSTAQGYCIDLFLEVLKLVPYDVPHRFFSFGDGLKNPSYDQLVRLVADDVLDAAVGDIAIVTNIIKLVDFTLPFAATGLTIPWSSGSSSIVQRRLPRPPSETAQNNVSIQLLHSIQSKLRKQSAAGKLVMVVWLFLLLVITSSYTASLSSVLTVQQLSTSITRLDSLISSGLPIGYQVGSFAYSYMTNNLNIHPSRLISSGEPEEYEAALKRGPANGGIAAIVDETPYVELFLSKQKDYGMARQPFTKSGWEFAFQKNSPLVVDVSTAILKLAESGQLGKINNRWFCKSGCPGEQGKKPEPDELHLNSFLVLYSLTGIAAVIAFSVFLFRAFRQYIDYKRRQLQSDPSSLAA
ncbi:hypothetical protein SASPL_153992 [Salvia splendens]|uniref:Glutamate receptor n=1 Tax=Salvia splendens TaxID=180675 RepID=A0A8X8VZH3_SALSN|nr:hypothetical protein SASPL_153992 [Salvia splendens]